jgi:hypothetical protein
LVPTYIVGQRHSRGHTTTVIRRPFSCPPQRRALLAQVLSLPMSSHERIIGTGLLIAFMSI